MRMTVLLAVSAVALAACSGPAERETGPDEGVDGAVDDASWTYDNSAEWGTANEDYATCATGTVQSPINFVRADATDSEDVSLQINWQSGPMTIEGAGYNSNVVAPEGGYIMLEGERYDFIQAHMHMPSEYTIEGEQPAGDIHFVHASEAGELAVIGVFLAEGEANEALAAAFDAFSTDEGSQTLEGVTFDPSAVLPETQSFFRFPGSLTTPPCSEGVNWVFMSEPVTISAEQITAYTELYGNTARPVQPTGDREILFVGG
ncbi:carbonic anhydrase family protein [Parasphingopyxis sp. CP4]|uniref:carbonic anhydrase n=1 Tax=Parasphingopyxis sp. CP4 TaxID=2724527 RepID=UPI0015A0A3F7|nr:carbonic anhydrase family protein [Parasphingopyxis sp. CP4]QLC22244.1 carbonic anhydrase family protein [Parasphingopyxis sp. CP4]